MLASSEQVVEWAKANTIDFVVVGPEDPLTAGVVDELEKAGILAFGPNKAAAELEGSKAFMKDILQKYNVSNTHMDYPRDQPNSHAPQTRAPCALLLLPRASAHTKHSLQRTCAHTHRARLTKRNKTN